MSRCSVCQSITLLLRVSEIRGRVTCIGYHQKAYAGHGHAWVYFEGDGATRLILAVTSGQQRTAGEIQCLSYRYQATPLRNADAAVRAGYHVEIALLMRRV